MPPNGATATVVDHDLDLLFQVSQILKCENISKAVTLTFNFNVKHFLVMHLVAHAAFVPGRFASTRTAPPWHCSCFEFCIRYFTPTEVYSEIEEIVRMQIII